jgi:hypothetical protein
MTLPLPPKGSLKSDATSVKQVRDLLTSVIAGHPRVAMQPCTFYEELDAWLGPWGDNGYPIGYGKFYCIAFNSNEKLLADQITNEWVKNTTVALQQSLVDYIGDRQRAGTLGSITEPQLRGAAFASHAKAYTDGGLAKVACTAPELLPIIALIPKREFKYTLLELVLKGPAALYSDPTLRQVLETVVRVSARLPGYVLPALAGPAHTGIFRIAATRDAQAFQMEMRLGRELEALRNAINDGELDDVQTLTIIIDKLDATRFPDSGLATLARMIISSAELRKQMLQKYYKDLLPRSPAIQKEFESRFGSLLR